MTAFAFFLVTPPLTHAAVNVNGAGTLLDTRQSQLSSSPEGAVTTRTFDVSLPSALQFEIAAIGLRRRVWAIASAEMTYAAPAGSVASPTAPLYGLQSPAGVRPLS